MVAPASTVFIAVVALSLGACGERPTPPAAVHPVSVGPTTGTSVVTIEAFSFRPNPLVIAPGTRVVWSNEDSARHTVTSGRRTYDENGQVDDVKPSGRFDAQLRRRGSTASFIFREPGRFTYFCTLHPGMDGTVTVRPAASG